jgi:hypothetical protein
MSLFFTKNFQGAFSLSDFSKTFEKFERFPWKIDLILKRSPKGTFFNNNNGIRSFI